MSYQHEAGLRERIGQLETALAEARKDGERLDWLESKGLSTTHGEDGRRRDYGVHSWIEGETGKKRWTARFISSDLPTLRAAIDAALEAELAEARKDGERWEHRYRYLRKITEAALPENMGGYPDLFYPEGFDGSDDSASPWELWESAVKIEAKHVDAAVAERAARGAK